MTDNNVKRKAWTLAWLLVWHAIFVSLQAQEVVDSDELMMPQEVQHADTFVVDSVVVDTALVWPQNIQARIDLLLQNKMFEKSTVGLIVYDLTADSVVFKYNERQCMRPASTMKMISAVTALDRLGGSYQFKTQLKYTGKVANGVLEGNVYCQGGFDPRFNNDDMNAFVESLRRMGIDTIRGNVYADLSMKDSDLLGEGWCWDDDNPVLTPLLLSGKDRFMQRFCKELKDAKIVLTGDTLRGTTPHNAFDLCTRFHTMDQILMRMMKKSDNLYAEAMFYQTAAAQGGRGATAKDGRTLTNRLISKLGFNSKDFYVADGSGLSLYNYVSPELEVAFLRYAYRNSAIFIHLLPSLPIAGVDGTLEKRMKNGFAHENVKAKTGTVTGVSALTGYCTAANGHYLCFSIINMGIRKAAVGRTFQDLVCEALCMP